MRSTIIAAALTVALTGPVLAQRQGGYSVEGQNPDGQRYGGTAMLEPTGTNTWRVTWNAGGGTAQGVAILIPQGPLLVVGYTMQGDTGVAVYAVQPDGRLLGTWTQGQGGGIGTETLTPVGGQSGK